MRKYFLAAAVFIASACLLHVPAVKAADKADHDCMKCHKLSADDASNILKNDIPDVKIIEIRPAPVKGFWEFTFESQGKKNIGYLDFSKEKLLIGSIIDLKEKKNLTRERFVELNKIDVAQIPLGDALLMGDKNAKTKIIVFDDPD